MNDTNLIKKLNTLYIIKKTIVISKRLNKPKQLQRMGINKKNVKIILKNTYKKIVIFKKLYIKKENRKNEVMRYGPGNPSPTPGP